MSGVRRTATWVGVSALLVYALSGGGRIVGSDEVTMLQLSRALLRGQIAVPPGATRAGTDGRHYTKNAAGVAVLALPLTGVAELAAGAAGLPEPRRELAVRFVVSFFNAGVCAVLVGAFYAAARGLGVGARAALWSALMLAFTTPLWVYAKSFMAEPLQALGLLLALAGAAETGVKPRAPWVAALGVALAVSVKLSMLPLALACLVPMIGSGKSWRVPLAGLALALAGHLAYNAARFGTPLETGYGAQATAAAYTTPLLVGLYGLLLSSGKGIAWFAPALWLALPGWRAARRDAGAGPRAAAGVLVAWLVALPVYATFEHWAGDGSFGPRYLVPLTPLAMLLVAFAIDRGPGLARRLAPWLAAAGLVVQLGGVGIYYGAQMREAGDYPYTRALKDPRFMSDSHFNPAFSPILGHWRMLARNAAEHLRGERPRLGIAGDAAGAAARDPRTGLDAGETRALLHAIDVWWCYALYAGLPRAPIAGAALALAALLVWALSRLARAAAADRGAESAGAPALERRAEPAGA